MLHKDSIEVIGAHAAAIAISFSDVEQSLKIISLLTAIIFTIYKFRNEYKDRQERKKPNQIHIETPHLNGHSKNENSDIPPVDGKTDF